MRLVMIACALSCVAVPAIGQETTEPQTAQEWQAWVPDPASVEMPVLAFEEDQNDIDNYEKYYFFHREDTDFATALQDLRECDSHARGLFRGNWYPDMTSTTVMYGVGGLMGGLIGGALSDAIHGSALIRLNRRVNMRRCLNYKGYSRFGIDKGLWEEFNFEEGNTDVAEGDRQQKLAQQALVASGSRPQAEELGL